MSRTELQLLAALLGLYLLEYIRWIRNDEVAYTRRIRSDWKTWKIGPKSFTLLGFSPVLPSFLLRPGLIRIRPPHKENSELEARLASVAHQLDSLRLLRTLAQVQAVLFLILLPAVLYLHRLTRAWPILLGTLLLCHAMLVWSLLRALKRSDLKATYTLVGPVLFNPVGATRVLDTLGQLLYDRSVNIEAET